ncbi:MAG: hypothetical protein ISS31_03925 [Kiritimatiellae bacterium]|nr:hypothetical protein [Kiritimatiellia bacterium]
MKPMPFICAITMAALLPALASADIVAGWEVTGIDLDDNYSAPYTIGADTTATHVLSAEISLPYSVVRSTSTNKYGFKISGGSEQTTLGGAITAGHYIEVTMTAVDLYGFNLSSLEINGEATGDGCNDLAVLSSVDGFSSDKVIASVTGVAGATGGWDTDASGFGAPIALSDSKYTELEDVTFRFYGWNSSSGTGSTRIRSLLGYDIVFNGTVEKIPRRGAIMIIR